MDKADKNRQLILSYYNAISGREKTNALLSRFCKDSALVEQVLFIEQMFPRYSIIVDEITCEEDRVVVRARARGKHTGSAAGLPPTYRSVEVPFVIGYRVENERIIDHWYFADQMGLAEQLGLAVAS